MWRRLILRQAGWTILISTPYAFCRFDDEGLFSLEKLAEHLPTSILDS